MVKKLLNITAIFNLFQAMIRKPSFIPHYVKAHIEPVEGMRILDIGCGSGDILKYLPKVDYIGFDVSEAYITHAKKHYGHLGEFHCRGFDKEDVQRFGTFDRVLFNGVLHHLNDGLAKELLELVAQSLKPGGRLVAFDPCYKEKQNPIAKKLIDNDRGQYVRERQGYLDLFSESYHSVEEIYNEEMLRLPYTLLFTVAKVKD